MFLACDHCGGSFMLFTTRVVGSLSLPRSYLFLTVCLFARYHGSWDKGAETRNVILMNCCTLAHFCNSQFRNCLSQCVFCIGSRGILNIPKHSIIKIANKVYWQSNTLSPFAAYYILM